jgi:hypothetical protein
MIAEAATDAGPCPRALNPDRGIESVSVLMYLGEKGNCCPDAKGGGDTLTILSQLRQLSGDYGVKHTFQRHWLCVLSRRVD